MQRTGYGERWTGPLGLATVLAVAALAAALALVVASVQAGPAEAAFPGKNGRIVFDKPDGTERNDYELYSVRPDGSDRIRLTDNNVDDVSPTWSPDGRSIAYTVLNTGCFGSDIYRINLGDDGRPRGNRIPVAASETVTETFPAWSPDGRQIAYSRAEENCEGDFDIYRKKSDGSGPATHVADAEELDFYPAWSPDGDFIAFSGTIGFFGGSSSAVYVVPASGGSPTAITEFEEGAYGPDWSPDGESIAYAAFESESQFPSPFGYKIFTRPFSENGVGEREQVTDQSFTLDVFPAYSPEGDQIVFKSFAFTSSAARELEPPETQAAPQDLGTLVRELGDGRGTLGEPSEGPISGIQRVPSEGGEEQFIPGTGSRSASELDVIFPGPDWGPLATGGGDNGGNDRPQCTIRGTSEGEAITGTEGRDVICAGGGGDSINALGGNDVVFGGAGNDSINGNEGDDELFGEGGDDTLNGGPGRDRLVGGTGKDQTKQ